MKILSFNKPRQRAQLLELFAAEFAADAEVEAQVRSILETVRTQGDAALELFTRRFDEVDLSSDEFAVPAAAFERARELVSAEFTAAIARAKDHIERYHRRQIESSWEFERDGVRLGQKVLPIGSVGLYVPGGQALYPSTVLMTAIPAGLAGVRRLVMVTPARTTGVDPHVLLAASAADVDEVYQVGGAQAIAALAYGTATLPRVDKIVGPGNVYVNTAKRLLYGIVDIDNVAGPSEIVVLADDSANPEWVAFDMLSQLEHDVSAKAVLVTPSSGLAARVRDLARSLAKGLPRRQIVQKALDERSAVVTVTSMEEAIRAVDEIAPEHLEVMTEGARSVADRITNAGCIFVGPYSPVPMGDYIAGTNHTLPTARTARFGSPLGVADFCKRIGVVEYSKEAFLRECDVVTTLASVEGLPNHAEAVRIRKEAV